MLEAESRYDVITLGLLLAPLRNIDTRHRLLDVAGVASSGLGLRLPQGDDIAHTLTTDTLASAR